MHHFVFRLGTLEVANEKLASLNSISEQNFQIMSADFKDNTRTLMNMKKQLDSVFRRIRYMSPLVLPALFLIPSWQVTEDETSFTVSRSLFR